MRRIQRLRFDLVRRAYSTTQYGPTHATFPLANGHELYYTTYGPATAPSTFVLIHGAPGSHLDFKHLAPLLVRDDTNVIAFDLPGNGRTSADAAGGPSGLTAVAIKDAVVEAVDGLGLERTYILGHSCGGHTALQTADSIRRVDGIALLNSMGTRPHQAVRPFGPIRFAARQMQTPGLARDICVTVNSWIFLHVFKFPRKTPLDDMTYACQRSGTVDFDGIRLHAESLGRRQVPSFVAIALDDVLVEKEIGHELGALLHPGIRLEYVRGGHNIQKTQCGPLAEALLAWSAGHP
ncbi:serine protease family S33 [Achlya hypogyna]|uniref:Serine protease family S33 n=1 Tax=Achlya hypogyna TaxID=1202772 RepID=A0A1V9ZB21_ACHHY|nr:serine protease family S33 [Achlya hypogyna]